MCLHWTHRGDRSNSSASGRSARRWTGRAILAAAVAGQLPNLALAQDSTWITNANGVWNTAANWNNGVPGPAAVASFINIFTTTRTITIDTAPSLSSVRFETTAAGTVNFTSSTGVNFITMTGPNPSIVNNSSGQGTGGNTWAGTIGLDSTTAITGSGAGTLNLTAIIRSITPGTGLNINTTPATSEAGPVILAGANTFDGGVTLTSGNLALGTATALGAAGNTLAVDGGNVLFTAAVTIANGISLGASDLRIAGTTGTTLTGIISDGAGVRGVNHVGRSSAVGTPMTVTLQGNNSYDGPTNVGVATMLFLDSTNQLVFSGANGRALNSNAINVTGGGTVAMDNSGIAAAISRFGATTPVTLRNGTLRLTGSTGTTGSFQQQLGDLTGAGLSQVVVALTSGTAEGAELNFTSLDRATNRGT